MNPPADTALQSLWQHTRRHALRSALFLAGLCTTIAVLLSVLDSRHIGFNFVYSFCIGTACSLLMDSVRLATAALSDAWYRARGLPPDPATFGRGSGMSSVVTTPTPTMAAMAEYDAIQPFSAAIHSAPALPTMIAMR